MDWSLAFILKGMPRLNQGTKYRHENYIGRDGHCPIHPQPDEEQIIIRIRIWIWIRILIWSMIRVWMKFVQIGNIIWFYKVPSGLSMDHHRDS